MIFSVNGKPTIVAGGPGVPLKGECHASSAWFVWTIAFMVVDLCQLQLMFKPISALRPGLLVTVILTGYIIFNWSLVVAGWSRQLTYIVLFVLLLFVLTPFAHNNYRAFMTGRSMLLMLPFLFSLSSVIYSKGRLLRLLLVFELISFALSLYCFGHGGRGPGGMMSDENDLTLFIVIVLPFTFFLFSRSNRKVGKIFHLAVIGCSLVAIVRAFSRGGFIGLMAMLFVCWIFSKKKIQSLVGITLIFGGLYFVGGDVYVNEMKTVTNSKDSTANERILSWKAGWHMFLDNPLGVGGSNYPVRFPEYQPKEMRRNMWGRVAHSLWFTLIPELGIIGIVLYAALLLGNYKDISLLLRPCSDVSSDEDSKIFYRDIGKALSASLIGFFVSATFISVLYYTHYWYLCILIDRISKSRHDFCL